MHRKGQKGPMPVGRLPPRGGWATRVRQQMSSVQRGRVSWLSALWERRPPCPASRDSPTPAGASAPQLRGHARAVSLHRSPHPDLRHSVSGCGTRQARPSAVGAPLALLGLLGAKPVDTRLLPEPSVGCQPGWVPRPTSERGPPDHRVSNSLAGPQTQRDAS
jgi:hypothetical protein